MVSVNRVGNLLKMGDLIAISNQSGFSIGIYKGGRNSVQYYTISDHNESVSLGITKYKLSTSYISGLSASSRVIPITCYSLTIREQRIYSNILKFIKGI